MSSSFRPTGRPTSDLPTRISRQRRFHRRLGNPQAASVKRSESPVPDGDGSALGCCGAGGRNPPVRTDRPRDSARRFQYPAQQGIGRITIITVFGAAVFLPSLLRLLGLRSLGLLGEPIRSLGVLGCIVLLGMAVDTYLSVTGKTNGIYMIPRATILVAVRRAWKGRWLRAIIIGVACPAAVLITQVASH